jgi:hypothetical protein
VLALIGAFVSPGAALAEGPQVAPSGRIAVLSYTRGSVASWLEVASLDGSNRTAVTRVPGRGDRRFVEGAVWSPDGSKLAYVFYTRSFRRVSLYVVNADGTGRHRLATWKQVGMIDRFGIVWAPDGSRIAFSATQREFNQRPSDPALYSVNADGSALQRLPALPPDWPDLNQPIVQISPVGWSPDGRNLFYKRDVFRDNEYRTQEYEFSNLYRIDLETLARTELRASDLYDSYSLSPTGALLAAAPFAYFGEALLLFDSNGGSLGMLYEPDSDCDVFFGEMAWLQGDKALLIGADGDCLSGLFAIDVQTREFREIATNGYYSDPTVSADGNLLSFLDADDALLLHVVRADNGQSLLTAPIEGGPGAAGVGDVAVHLNPQS